MSTPPLVPVVAPPLPGTTGEPARARAELWLRLRQIVLDAVSSPHSKRAYGKALDDFFDWYEQTRRSALGKALVQEYRAFLEQAGLAPSTINVRLAAVKKLASEAADNGLLDQNSAAAIGRVKGAKRMGVRVGNWLEADQARQLLGAPRGATRKAARDRAILGLLLGCALRRTELASLRLDQIQQRAGRWVIPDLTGKGNRVRTVPVPAWTKELIDRWVAVSPTHGEGFLFQPINKADQVGDEPLGESAVWEIVRGYAEEVGLGRVAPHDLRRTCAKLCRASGGAIEQIQLLLGHASIQTTMDYLGTQQDLAEAVNDRLGLS